MDPPLQHAYLLQVLLQLGLGILHLCETLLEVDIDCVALLTHVAGRVLQHIVDQRAQLNGGHALVLCPRNVVMGKLGPGLWRALAAGWKKGNR